MNTDMFKQIAERYELLLKRHAPMDYWNSYTRVSLHMDLEVVENVFPLFRWVDLLYAADSDFFHDIHGIRANIDRERACMMNHFRPRYAGKSLQEEQAEDMRLSLLAEIDKAKKAIDQLKSCSAWITYGEREFQQALNDLVNQTAFLIGEVYDEDITAQHLGVTSDDPIQHGESEASENDSNS